jgi:hypothetical protein
VPQADQQIFQSARRELFSVMIGDEMEKMGRLRQFQPPAIVPLDRSMIVCGRAVTVLDADCFDESVNLAGGSHHPLSARPFGLMMGALDHLKLDTCKITTGLRSFPFGANYR